MATAATVPTDVIEKQKKAKRSDEQGEPKLSEGSQQRLLVSIEAEKSAHEETRKLLLAARVDYSKLAARAKRYQSLAEQLVQECEYFVKTHGSDYARRRSAEVKKELQEIAKL